VLLGCFVLLLWAIGCGVFVPTWGRGGALLLSVLRMGRGSSMVKGSLVTG
jgi:hypothetical protein